MTHRIESTPGSGRQDEHPGRRTPQPPGFLPERQARRIKAMGVAGTILLIAGIALLGVTIVAIAIGAAATPWLIAVTAISLIAALAGLVGPRLMLTSHPAQDRAQHDPLMPEVTAEEAAEYEHEHPHPRASHPVPPRRSR